MRRATTLAAWGICASLAIACGGPDRAAQEEQRDTGIAGDAGAKGADIDTGRPAPIIETGCLTESGGRFALTGLDSAADGTRAAATQTYRLIGDADELRQHVGREVRVSGEAPPPQVAEVREQSSAPVGTGGDKPDQPQVTTQAQTRLEVSELRVIAVTPTGNSCK